MILFFPVQGDRAERKRASDLDDGINTDADMAVDVVNTMQPGDSIATAADHPYYTEEGDAAGYDDGTGNVWGDGYHYPASTDEYGYDQYGHQHGGQSGQYHSQGYDQYGQHTGQEGHYEYYDPHSADPTSGEGYGDEYSQYTTPVDGSQYGGHYGYGSQPQQQQQYGQYHQVQQQGYGAYMYPQPMMYPMGMMMASPMTPYGYPGQPMFMAPVPAPSVSPIASGPVTFPSPPTQHGQAAPAAGPSSPVAASLPSLRISTGLDGDSFVVRAPLTDGSMFKGLETVTPSGALSVKASTPSDVLQNLAFSQ